MSKDGVYLEFDDAVQQLTLGLQAKDAAVNKAIRRAIAKLTKWLARQITQSVSKETGVAQKSLKPRVVTKLNKDKKSGWLWFGLNPVSLHKAGRVSWSQKSAGAKVGGERYEGAFYRQIYGAEKKVYIRSSRNAVLNHPRAGQKRRARGGSPGMGGGRFPVEILGIEIEKAGRESIKRIERRAASRFREILEQELRFALKHE